MNRLQLEYLRSMDETRIKKWLASVLSEKYQKIMRALTVADNAKALEQVNIEMREIHSFIETPGEIELNELRRLYQTASDIEFYAKETKKTLSALAKGEDL